MARSTLIGLVVLVLLGGTGIPDTARAERSMPVTMALGVSSVAATIPYGIVKSLYAAGGVLTGALAYILTGGRRDVATAIMQPAVRGDYVVTPEHLTMNQSLQFSGRDPVQADSSY